MATPNPASNFPNVASLSNQLLAYYDTVNHKTVWTAVQDFLTSQTQTDYDTMAGTLANAIVDASFQQQAGKLHDGSGNPLRLLVAIDDGTVAFDSGKMYNGDVCGNVFSNYKYTVNANGGTSVSGGINVNHNTRPEIMTATLSSSGVAISSRYSRSQSSYLKYQATRLGTSSSANLGTFRVSIQDILPN
jgi:hypothetical protein